MSDRNISKTKKFNCITCGTEDFIRFNSANKYCSYKCNPIYMKGRIIREESKNKMSISAKGIHKSPRTEYKKGLRVSMATEFKSGKENRNWIDGSSLTEIRYTREYRFFRKAVLERDKKCVICGNINNLQVDHIQPQSLYPDLVYSLDNARVLCKSCHLQTPTYGGRIRNYKEVANRG